MGFNNNEEHKIRNIKIRGIPVSVSHQAGGLIIWGKPEYRGKSVRLKGGAFTPASGMTFSASFVGFSVNGHKNCVAIFNRLPPSGYYTDTYISDHRYEEITITTGYVSQADWR
jgi:hypothetical protein